MTVSDLGLLLSDHRCSHADKAKTQHSNYIIYCKLKPRYLYTATYREA